MLSGKEAITIDNISDIEAYRKLRKKKKRKKRLITFLIVALLIAVIAILGTYFSRRGNIGDLEDTNSTAEKDTSIAANGFPISLGGNNPLDITGCGKNILLLTKNNLISVSESGKQIYSVHHGYSNPVMTASSKRVLTYDLGGYQFRLDTAKSAIGTKKLTEPIALGAVSNDGHVAIVTQTERYSVSLKIYDSALQEMFSWNVTDKIITAIDFNNRSNACVVSALSVQDGSADSKIYELSFQAKKEVFETTLEDCMAISVDYKANGTIGIVTDTAVYLLDSSGKMKSESIYSGKLLLHSNTSSDSVVVLLEDTQNTRNTRVLRIDENGNTAASTEISESAVDAKAADDYLLVLGEDRVTVFDNNLQQIKTVQTGTNPLRTVLLNQKGYILSASQLTQFLISK